MTERQEKSASGTPIVSICSGKGGVGKSVLAFNLAERLASMGARVLLVDADINYGDLHILTNSNGISGFRELICGELPLKKAVTVTTFGFDLLTSGKGDLPRIDGNIDAVADCMSELRREASSYHLIIMDQGSGISRWADVMARASDTALLVMVPELTSIAAGYELFKHLQCENSGFDCRLVVNRAESASEAEFLHTKLCAVTERFLGSTPPYLGYISENQLIPDSVSSQTAISAIAPESQIVQELTSLAGCLARIHGTPIETNSSGTANKQNGINKTTALADIRE